MVKQIRTITKTTTTNIYIKMSVFLIRYLNPSPETFRLSAYVTFFFFLIKKDHNIPRALYFIEFSTYVGNLPILELVHLIVLMATY